MYVWLGHHLVWTNQKRCWTYILLTSTFVLLHFFSLLSLLSSATKINVRLWYVICSSGLTTVRISSTKNVGQIFVSDGQVLLLALQDRVTIENYCMTWSDCQSGLSQFCSVVLLNLLRTAIIVLVKGTTKNGLPFAFTFALFGSRNLWMCLFITYSYCS